VRERYYIADLLGLFCMVLTANILSDRHHRIHVVSNSHISTLAFKLVYFNASNSIDINIRTMHIKLKILEMVLVSASCTGFNASILSVAIITFREAMNITQREGFELETCID
jgi:hypothetical protein